jgi:hypothetical protein
VTHDLNHADMAILLLEAASGRLEGRADLQVAAAQAHALLAIDGRLAGFTAALQALTAADLPDPDCPHCQGAGYIEGPLCNCGAGSASAYGMHERYCGLEPCASGCPFVPPRPPQRLGGGA